MANFKVRRQHSVEVEIEYNIIYPFDLQMYDVPPSGCIQLEELYQWCSNRLFILKLVDKISMQNYGGPPERCFKLLVEELQKNHLEDFTRLISRSELEPKAQQSLRRNDSTSHFMLRSALAFDEDKRNWFLKKEMLLFKWRFSALSTEDIEIFKRVNRLNYIPISKEEKEELSNYLIESTASVLYTNVPFYKVHFSKVLDLVADRKVYLKEGMAYVPETNFSALILPEYEKKLEEGCKTSREIAANFSDDERMTRIFRLFPTYVQTQYHFQNDISKVSVEELDELSRKSYPLCMRVLHEELRKTHHVTNGGRVQYVLFMKGMGLGLEDTMKFWYEELTKRMNETTFYKEHRYGIRHLYGLEGKRYDYPPFSCSKILSVNIGPRDKHGCPFKHLSTVELRETLSEIGFLKTDIESIVRLSDQRNFAGACKRYYEVTQNCEVQEIFGHPNVYFNKSRARIEGKKI